VADASGSAPDVLISQAGDWRARALRLGQLTADDGVELAVRAAPDVRGRAVVEVGTPVDVLVEASRRADLVVVGTRGRGDLSAAWLGSVSTAVAAHAFSPVVIVRGDRRPAPGPSFPIVVGVDGSAASERAVEVAATVAAQTGARLEIVAVWTAPAVDGRMPALASDLSTGVDVLSSAARVHAEQAADEAVAQVRRSRPDVHVRRIVLEGYPAKVLAEAAEGAALLVVGSRGRGAFRGLVLGSVSHGAAHRAACPVMVVRAPMGPRRQEREASEPVHVMI
jgi:nucleotide-binding universal stress UspA family protein